MEALLSDFKYGVRSVRKDWRFAAMVVLTLAICIGANTALFTIVNSVLLQPLPVPGADSIILMSNKYPKAGIGDTNMSGAGDYYDRLRAVTSFQEQAMFKPIALTLNEHGSAERISGMLATPSLFRLLEVPPRPWPCFHRQRRRGRKSPEGNPQLRALAKTLCRRPGRVGTRAPSQ